MGVSVIGAARDRTLDAIVGRCFPWLRSETPKTVPSMHFDVRASHVPAEPIPLPARVHGVVAAVATVWNRLYKFVGFDELRRLKEYQFRYRRSVFGPLISDKIAKWKRGPENRKRGNDSSERRPLVSRHICNVVL